MTLNNKQYDVLNSMVRYVMPALGTLYFALSQLWGFPAPDKVVGTLVAIQAFMGVIIALARSGWQPDDNLLLDLNDPEELRFGFESGRQLSDLQTGDVLTLGVRRRPEHADEDLG